LGYLGFDGDDDEHLAGRTRRKENQLHLSLSFTVMDGQNGVWANGEGVHTRPEKKNDGRMVGFTVDWLGLQTRPSSN